jgi:hypothetical protein
MTTSVIVQCSGSLYASKQGGCSLFPEKLPEKSRGLVTSKVIMNLFPPLVAKGNLRPHNFPQKVLAITLCLALAFAFFLSPLCAQESGSAVQQQIGPDGQLRTGTNSGLDIETRIQNLLADHEYVRVESELSQLPPDVALVYRGVLANRSNDLNRSVQILEPLVDKVSASGNVGREHLLRKALAEDYLRLGQWAKAAEAYQALDSRLHDKITPDEQAEIEMPVRLLPLAKDNPTTTVEPCDPFKLPVSQSPLGLVDLPVFVDARSHNWMLDPTQPFNLISRSTAREAGLRISPESVTITVLRGHPIQVHATVIPRFTIGSRLVIHDMTAFVYEDKDYYFPLTHYQVQGVLGYPAVAAIGSITVNSDNSVLIRPPKQLGPLANGDLLTTGTRFYLDGDQVIVAIGTGQQSSSFGGAGDDRMYAVDAGAQQTYLTSRYFDEHAADFNNQKMDMFSFLGQSSPPQPAYLAETIPFHISSTEFDFHFLRVLTQPLGNAALDDVYGILGVDALSQLKNYTFDYRTMRFAAEPQ